MYQEQNIHSKATSRSQQSIIAMDRELKTGNGRDISTFEILVVEDNAINQQVMAHYLENLGPRFQIVSNGLQALEAARSGRFDLILMDIQMPVMDGIEATIQIRKLSGLISKVPIFAVTAHTDESQYRSYLEVGMNGIVPKPIKAEHLHATILSVLSNTQSSI